MKTTDAAHPVPSVPDPRADVRRRLRREGASLFVIAFALVAGVMLVVTDSLPALHGDDFTSSALAGFLMGMFSAAGAATAVSVVRLRRALTDDAALRQLRARDNDELTAHVERETARTFVQVFPALAVLVAFATALVSAEALVAALATLVFLAVALIVVKLACKARYAA